MTAAPLLLLLLGRAGATPYSMPTSEDWYSWFVVSAYKDEGSRDWNCGSNYYSGHGGTDFAIYGSWTTMAYGVDVTAAADGTVYSTHDGESDTCSSGACGTANYVILRHDDGAYTIYWHFKTWSVAVSPGETATVQVRMCQ